MVKNRFIGISLLIISIHYFRVYTLQSCTSSFPKIFGSPNGNNRFNAIDYNSATTTLVAAGSTSSYELFGITGLSSTLPLITVYATSLFNLAWSKAVLLSNFYFIGVSMSPNGAKVVAVTGNGLS